MGERYKCWTCIGTGTTVSGRKIPCPRCEGRGYTGDAMDYVRSEEERDREVQRHYRDMGMEPYKEWNKDRI